MCTLVLAELVKKCSTSYGTGKFIICSLDLATGPYPELVELAPQPHTLSKIHFDNVSQCKPRSLKRPLIFSFSECLHSYNSS
jgi:hypothetical protein